MKRILVVLLVLVLGGIGFRFLQILPYPTGTGNQKVSPDGKHTASITAYYKEDFWGHRAARDS